MAREQINRNFGDSNVRGERDTLVIMPNGGIELGRLFTILENAAYLPVGKNTIKPPLEYIHNVLIGLKQLGLFVARMNSAGIYHNDIQFDNILYNQDTKEARLIDFELGGKKKDSDLYDIMRVINQIYEFQSMIYKIEAPAFKVREIAYKNAKEYTNEMFMADMELIK